MMSSVEMVVIGASLGGLDALEELLSGLPADFPPPTAIAQHRRPDDSSRLVQLLASHCALPVLEPEDKDPIEPGHVYLAPPDYHLLIDGGRWSLSTEGRVSYARPSIDVLFESAADAFGARMIAVVLTGSNADGALGIQAIKQRGGIAIVQDPRTALSPVAPQAVLDSSTADYILPLGEISALLVKLCRKRVPAPVRNRLS